MDYKAADCDSSTVSGTVQKVAKTLPVVLPVDLEMVKGQGNMVQVLLDNTEVEVYTVVFEVEVRKRTLRSLGAALCCMTVVSVLLDICCKQYATLKLRQHYAKRRY